MLAKIHSGGVYGIDAFTVEVEVDTGTGEEMRFFLVGLPDAAVRESKDRVVTAIFNSGFAWPVCRTTINLAPADVRKEGPVFDLPIALGMLAADKQIHNPASLEGVCAIGELALSGEVRRVRGILPIAINAQKSGFTKLFVPVENAREAAVVEGIDIYPIENLRDAVLFLNGDLDIAPQESELEELFADAGSYPFDFSDVKGQEYAKRATEVAIAGGHNVLMIGSPGTGKTMLAKRVPTILPPMSLPEALETTKIHSIAGKLPSGQALIAQRPFRSPHHTVSDAGLLGGGTHPMPGEVSLAHHGVLFLDELPEFARNVLEVLRQPLEDGEVTIARAAATVTFPSRMMLVAAMNPCPCGYNSDPRRECRCSQIQIQNYRNKISGPLLDRIDIHIEVPSVPFEQLTGVAKGETSADIRKRVVAARNIQHHRYADAPHVHSNAMMGTTEKDAHCQLDDHAQSMLKMAVDELNLSARAYDRILKVGRTIADLSGSEPILAEHLTEAIQYRTLDRQLWR